MQKEVPLPPSVLYAVMKGCDAESGAPSCSLRTKCQHAEDGHAWAMRTSLGRRTNLELAMSVLLFREIITCLVYTALSQISGDLWPRHHGKAPPFGGGHDLGSSNLTEIQKPGMGGEEKVGFRENGSGRILILCCL